MVVRDGLTALIDMACRSAGAPPSAVRRVCRARAARRGARSLEVGRHRPICCSVATTASRMQGWAFTVVVALAMLLLAWWLAGPTWQRWRRHRISRRPFPAAWREVLRRQVPIVRRLPAALQMQLKRRMLVFIADKPIIGCKGLQVSEAMRVVIAAQACLLLLNHRGEGFPELRQVLLYPDTFVVDRVAPAGAGVLQEQRRALSGESWSQGQVILSWADVQAGAAAPDDGRNVVIHEFAHQLDQETGAANGAPWLGRRERYERWSRVLGAEFERLRERIAHGEPTLLGDYAATAPAEFFAVASEVFFEQPGPLAADAPALYREFSAYYRVDPLNW
jgi:MtfA peptidase